VGGRNWSRPVTAERFDLADPTLLFRDDVLEDPTGLYRQLRAEAPVWEVPGTATFVVTRADLVNEAVARVKDFSSNLNSVIYRGADGLPRTFEMAAMGDAIHVLATADPPVHTKHRSLLRPSLAPRCMAMLEGELTAMVDDLLARMLATGGGDLITGLADPLPMQVIGRVIGLPPEDSSELVKLVLDVDQLLAGFADEAGMARATAAAMQQATYLAGHLQQVIDDPTSVRDDTLLFALGEPVKSGNLTFEEGIGILTQILGAGTETTTSLISTAVRIVAQDDRLQHHLRREPDAIPTFLEEVLRLDGPFRFHYRTTFHDTELGGVDIPAGARVLLMWAAANLDESAYPNPESLDLDRAIPRSHLAFGRGIHFCIGAPLARLEARIALTRLLESTATIRIDPEFPPLYHRDIFLRRLARLGVVFR
jgi:cytochrome P450